MLTLFILHSSSVLNCSFQSPLRQAQMPPEAFGTAPQSFCTPANYIYFDLIVSYLIILTTKFVKLQYYGLRSRHAGLENRFC
jgi:hypothetical protein